MNLKRLGRVLRRLWFFHINLKYRLNLNMENCCPGSSPCCPLSRYHLPRQVAVERAAKITRCPPVAVPLQRARQRQPVISAVGSAASCLGSLLHVAGSTAAVAAPRQRADNPGQQFQLLNFRESNPKFLSPQFLLNRHKPHFESRCGNTRDVREPDTLVFSPNTNFLALWCSRSVLFAMTPTAERLSK